MTAAAALEAQIAEIQAALMERCDGLGTRIADTIWRDVKGLADSSRISRDEVRTTCRTNLRLLIENLDAPDVFDTGVAASSGTDRAVAGTPLPAVMEGYRIGSRLVWEEIIDLAATRPHIGREALIRATARIWMAQDVYTHAMVNAYRDEMTRQVLTRETQRVALIEALLEGRVVEEAGLWEIATILRLPVRGPYVVVAAECPAIGKSALPGIGAKLSSLDIASAWRLLPDIEIGLVHVLSDTKFDALTQTLTRLAATRIGISSRFDDLSRTPEAVTYARVALSTERANDNLVAVFEADPLAIAAVSAPDVMKEISASILAGFADLDDESRDQLFTTFRVWLTTGGSTNAAAAQLYCHPNTIRHRLHRIEERTGRSTTHPRELAELCLAFEIDRRTT